MDGKNYLGENYVTMKNRLQGTFFFDLQQIYIH